jgi:hypothetical protein
LLAVVDKSHAPIDKSQVQHPTAPAMPSSIGCPNRYNQHSAKKLLNQAVIAVAAMAMSTITKLPPIPELPPVVKQVLGGKHVMG